jgi:hypothetical protein
MVVELQERGMQPGDDEIAVVAGSPMIAEWSARRGTCSNCPPDSTSSLIGCCGS